MKEKKGREGKKGKNKTEPHFLTGLLTKNNQGQSLLIVFGHVGSVPLFLFVVTVGPVITAIWWHQPLHRPIIPALGGINGPPHPDQQYVYHSTPEHWSKLLVTW